MQKTNTLLLVIIAGLLAALLLKPAPKRYEVLPQNYLLDTATGKVVMIQVSEKVKADQRAREIAEQAEKKSEEAREKSEKDELLNKSCPEVLSRPVHDIASHSKGEGPLLGDVARGSLLEMEQRECQEWMMSKAAVSPSKSSQ